MKFSYNEIQYDTAEMLTVSEVDSYFVGLYITRDFRQVFGAYVSRDRGLEIVRLEGIALQMLAVRTGSPELRKAFELFQQQKNFANAGNGI